MYSPQAGYGAVGHDRRGGLPEPSESGCSLRMTKLANEEDLENFRSNAFAINLAFTTMLFVVFLGPVLLAVNLAQDPDAAFWMGSGGYGVLIAPVIFVVAHFAHVHRIRSGKRLYTKYYLFLLFCTILMFSTVGLAYQFEATFWYGQLESQDCAHGGLKEKHQLQNAYNEASVIYRDCVTRLYMENGNQTLPRRPLLQSCEEYARAFGDEGEIGFWQLVRRWLGNEVWARRHYKRAELRTWRKDWDYLASAEANFLCGGFCIAGPMLWSPADEIGRVGTSACSPAVALKFIVLEYHARTLVVSQLVIFLLIGPVIYYGHAHERELGMIPGEGSAKQSLSR